MNWSAKAEALGASIEKPLLHPQTIEWIEASSSPIGVACSGGSDSLAALLLIYCHFPALRPRLWVLHFNHQLRGKTSDEDASFIEEVAASLELSFKPGNWTDRDPGKPVSEASARQARQTFFDGFAKEHSGAMIVTGHQQNDILETLMLRIARSSNLVGLSAPRPVSEFPGGKTIVRPLLNLTKIRLESSIRDAGIEWRVDDSNQDSVFDRNRLRNDIIPAWQNATQFNLTQAASQVREYLEEADKVLDQYLVLADFPSMATNPARLPDRTAPRGALRRWLQLWLENQSLGGVFQRSMLNEVLDAIISAELKQWSAGTGFLRLSDTVISFRPTDENKSLQMAETSLSAGEGIDLLADGRLVCRLVQFSESLFKDLKKGKYSERTTVLIDSECIPDSSFLVRFWNSGDRYQALNAPGSRKLQDMFVDRKIPKEERIYLPVVLTTDSLIVWCPGLPVNHNVRITKKTKEILQLTYTKGH
jgi:tRNA(Ile)-lysidine synthase